MSLDMSGLPTLVTPLSLVWIDPMAARPPLPLRPSAQQITDARDEEILPFDGAAFWERLCQEIKRRVPVCDSPEWCRQWLVKNVRDPVPRTFQRWSAGTRPRWGLVRTVCTVLSKIEGAAPITEVELTIDLPLHRGPDTEEAGARSPALSASEPTTPPLGPTSASRAPRETPTDEPFADDLASLRDKLEALLQRARFLTEALA